MNWKSSIFRIMLVLLLGGAIGAGMVTWREYQRGERIQREIDTLRAEADKIRRENDSLSQKIMYFSSPDFQEREAKEKLGFRRQEEEVLILQGTPEVKRENMEEEEESGITYDMELPNYRKWWHLFFDPVRK